MSHHQWKTNEPIYDEQVVVTAEITGRAKAAEYIPDDPSQGLPEDAEVELTIEYDHPPYEDITDGPRRLHGEEVKQWEHWLDDLRQQALTLDEEERTS